MDSQPFSISYSPFRERCWTFSLHNVGAVKADPDSRYIAFLDNDALVQPSWLKECIELMERDEKIGVVQPKILIIGSEEHLDHVGLALDALGTWNSLIYEKERSYHRVLDIARSRQELFR